MFWRCRHYWADVICPLSRQMKEENRMSAQAILRRFCFFALSILVICCVVLDPACGQQCDNLCRQRSDFVEVDAKGAEKAVYQYLLPDCLYCADPKGRCRTQHPTIVDSEPWGECRVKEVGAQRRYLATSVAYYCVPLANGYTESQVNVIPDDPSMDTWWICKKATQEE